MRQRNANSHFGAFGERGRSTRHNGGSGLDCRFPRDGKNSGSPHFSDPLFSRVRGKPAYGEGMNPSLPDFSQGRVLVIGDIMLDRYVWGTVERISPEAPIPVVHIKDRTSRLGGAGNVAANLAGVGCKVSLIGILGHDPAGTELVGLLSTQGIADACICTTSLPTVTKTRIMAGPQQLVRLDDEQPGRVDVSLRREVLQKVSQELEQKTAVVISDYGKGLLNEGMVKDCIALCGANNIPVFIDPKRDDWSAYAGATCITPNLKEFKRACRQIGIDPAALESGALCLLEHYRLDHLLVTQGGAGMTLFAGQSPSCFVASQAREVYDVSGAGDTVIALMAAGSAVGLSLHQAMKLANLGAGEVVGRVGTYAITRSDLEMAVDGNGGNRSSACSLLQTQSLAEHWRMLGQTIVFTNGCFDILHPGHVSLVQRAKKLGDRLVVGLNTDASIRRIKGPSRPILTQDDRAAILAALNCVDVVVLFDEDTPVNLLKSLRPDVLVKGGDYTPDTVVGADLVNTWGGRVEILDLVGKKSTTAIVEKIRSGNPDASAG